MPALYATLIFSLFIGSLILFSTDYVDLAKSSFSSILSISNIYFLTTVNYFSGPSDFKPLVHTWSLGVEEQFYIIIPIFISIAFHFRTTFRILWIVGTLTSFLLAVLIVEFHIFDLSEKTAFYMMPTRAWELSVGGAIVIFPKFVTLFRRYADEWRGLGIGILVATFVFGGPAGFPGFGALPAVIGSSLIIVSENNNLSWTKRILSFRPLVFFGLISYSLYLLHWPIISFSKYYLQESFSTFLQLVILVVSITAAYIQWRFIELPFRLPTNVTNNNAYSSNAIWQRSVLGALVILGISYTIIFTKGYPASIPSSKTQESEVILSDRKENGTLTCKDNQVGSIFLRCAESSDFYTQGTVALIGDSHAAMIQNEFVRAANLYRLSSVISIETGCPPVLDLNISGNKPCNLERGQAFNELALKKKVIGLMLVARWPLYVEGWGFDTGKIFLYRPNKGIHKNYYSRLLSIFGEEHRPKGHDANAILLYDSLDKTISKVPKRIKIYILLPTPELHYFAPVKSNINLKFGRINKFGVTIGAYRQRTERFRNIVKQLKYKYGERIHILDPEKYLCKSGMCLGASGDEVYYLDANHLNNLGASKMRALFEEFAAKISINPDLSP